MNNKQERDDSGTIYILTSVIFLLIGITLLPKLSNYISASIYKFQNKLN